MDEYLKEHIFVKFVTFFILGVCLLVVMYLFSKSYSKKELEPRPENNLKRMSYWRSLCGMGLGVVIIVMSFYMLYEDLTNPEEANRNKIEKVQVRK
ncbi:putative membrane protein [Chryseobacterium defluvii]|uniref:Putative membrane protein n=1 Tax=Chryseobacterium defluvii TaxID=160396 RepID=A0A840KFP5_9FLAO|nr:hypothetical protein [Chryseobacterium defluvii]MBB4806848.1 putative membrane protein [Chryseobacterium defluvii]